jgi:membrane-associated phospholipid phosphatase
VAFAVFTAFQLGRLLRRLGAGRVIRAINWLWCLGILYSTVATLQHVVLDVLPGAVLGAAVALLHQRWLRGPG